MHQSVDMDLTSRVQCWQQRDCTLYHHTQTGTTWSPLTLHSSAESKVTTDEANDSPPSSAAVNYA